MSVAARSGARALGLVGLVAVLGGCGGTPPAPEALTNAGMRRLVEQKWELAQTTTASCMKKAGFRYEPVAFDPDDVAIATGDDPDARYLDVTMSVADARRKGFGVTDGSGSTAARSGDDGGAADRDANAAYEASLAPADFAAYQLALDAADGCRAQGERAAQRRFGRRERRMTSAADSVRTFVTTSPEFASILRRWSACMARRGWDDAQLVDFDATIRDQAQRRLDAAALPVSGDESPEGPPRFDEAQVRRIRAFEVGAAVDYVECFDVVRSDYRALVDDAYDRLR